MLRLEGDSFNLAGKPSPDPPCGRGPRDLLRPRHCGDARILRLLAIRPDNHDRPAVASSALANRLDAKEIGHLLFVARRHAVDFGDSEVRHANAVFMVRPTPRPNRTRSIGSRPWEAISRNHVASLPRSLSRHAKRLATAIRLSHVADVTRGNVRSVGSHNSTTKYVAR